MDQIVARRIYRAVLDELIAGDPDDSSAHTLASNMLGLELGVSLAIAHRADAVLLATAFRTIRGEASPDVERAHQDGLAVIARAAHRGLVGILDS